MLGVKKTQYFTRSEMAKETKVFQAEVKEILDLMVHSLYSQREIFLRELISNAADALDRSRFEQASNPELKISDDERHIRLIPSADSKTLTIRDNGIGMNYDDVVNNLGTIAHSGTREFVSKIKEMQDKPEFIGQFGVGFYSAFMVADKVTVHTQKIGEDEGIIWESTGDGQYSIEKEARPEGHGTTIVLHLKDFGDEEEKQDYTQQYTLQTIVRRYSDFIEWPIKMEMTREEPELDEEGKPVEGKNKTITEDTTLNSQKALWLRGTSDIKEDEYKEFYKHLTHDWNEPLETIHYKAEGTQEFASLLFIPGQVPFDYNQRDRSYGLNLYVKRVFIMNDCEELVPTWLRFMRGVVDSSDLTLNVSREILQKDRQIGGIRKAVVGKILKQLKQILTKDREKYEKFWDLFGSTLKEGLADFEYKEKLFDLVLFRSSHGDGYTTLAEYVKRMKEGQKDIYYITGDSVTTLKDSPFLEKIKKKDYEIIYMVDPVDEWVMQYVNKYDEKLLLSVAKDGIDIDSEEEKKETEEALKTKKEEFKDLLESMQKTLDATVKEVKVSDRLVDSPACLVTGAYDPTSRMEQLMKSMGQEVPVTKKIMEINPDHPVIIKLKGASSETQSEWTEILYNQALLSEGSAIDDPQKFSRQISKLMAETSL